MTSTMVTFLGRAGPHGVEPSGPEHVPERGSYRSARYELDGVRLEDTSFLGLALAHSLRPAKLVVLGTAGSMWDYLVEATDPEDQLEEERVLLMSAADRKEVTPAMLAPL